MVAVPTKTAAEPLALARAFDQARAPSHQRDWRPELAVLPYAEIGDSGAMIRNVRHCRWGAARDGEGTTQGDRTLIVPATSDADSGASAPAACRVRHRDWNLVWDEVRAVDFIVVPFADAPLLAHTMLSFALGDGRHLVASVEARLERDEVYSPTAGSARQYELMYVLADEQDVLGLRAEVRGESIYLYRSVATPDQSATLLKDVLRRVNAIAAEPEFYDSLTNNCTTNLVDHIDRLRPGTIPGSLRKMLPGHSDSLAYDLGLLKTALPFDEARRQAYVTVRVRQHLNDPQFSQQIRGRQ